MRRSQVTASSRPPPKQCPLRAATVGQGWAATASIASRKGWATRASASRSKADSEIEPMS